MLHHRINSACRPTASSYAARRLGLRPFILGHLGGPGTNAFSPASRVSISELLGGSHPRHRVPERAIS
jgi:hypothetical protein